MHKFFIVYIEIYVRGPFNDIILKCFTREKNTCITDGFCE